MGFSNFALVAPIRGPGGPIEAPGVFWRDFETGGNATATGPMFSSTADAAEWLTTLLTSAVPTVCDNSVIKGLTPQPAFGVIEIINAGTNDQSVSMQVNGEMLVLSPNKEVAFEIKLATSAIAGTLLFVGVANTDTTLLPAGGQTLGVTNAIGFTVRGTDGAILPIVKGAGTADSATGETLPTVITQKYLANSVFTVLRFTIQYDRNTGVATVKFYVDGVLNGVHKSTTAALPLDSTNATPIGLTPSITQKTQGSAANNLFIDYIFLAQERA